MRPTFLGFQTARSGLVASQKALDIVGNNIANLNTEGYTRQRVDLISMHISSTGNRYAVGNTMLAGQGVYMTGVAQIRDPFLDLRYREQSASLGELETISNVYGDLQNLFNDVTSSGLQANLDNLLKEFQSIQSSTEKPENLDIVRTAAQKLVQMLNTYDAKLTTLQQQNQTSLNACESTVNSILEKIASLNNQIKDATLSYTTIDPIYDERRVLGPYGPNELLDDRNLLLDQLSAYGEVSVKTDKDGNFSVTFGGTKVVDGDKYDILSIRQNALGENVLRWSVSSTDFTANSGAIKGYLNAIEGRGAYAGPGQKDFEGIEYYREVLNAFAHTFATALNEINTNDPAATPFPDGGDLFTGDGGTPPTFTAANIRISSDWMNDINFLQTTTTPAAGESYTPSNILRFIDVFNGDHTYSNSPTPTPGHPAFNGTYKEYLVNFQVRLGTNKDTYDSKLKSTNSVALELLDARDSVSAVSENEEAISMLQYQKTYNAASRMITTMDDMLDTLINRMGRVGL